MRLRVLKPFRCYVPGYEFEALDGQANRMISLGLVERIDGEAGGPVAAAVDPAPSGSPAAAKPKGRGKGR